MHSLLEFGCHSWGNARGGNPEGQGRGWELLALIRARSVQGEEPLPNPEPALGEFPSLLSRCYPQDPEGSRGLGMVFRGVLSPAEANQINWKVQVYPMTEVLRQGWVWGAQGTAPLRLLGFLGSVSLSCWQMLVDIWGSVLPVCEILIFKESRLVICRICIYCALSGWVNQLLFVEHILTGAREWEQMGFTGKAEGERG